MKRDGDVNVISKLFLTQGIYTTMHAKFNATPPPFDRPLMSGTARDWSGADFAASRGGGPREEEEEGESFERERGEEETGDGNDDGKGKGKQSGDNADGNADGRDENGGSNACARSAQQQHPS